MAMIMVAIVPVPVIMIMMMVIMASCPHTRMREQVQKHIAQQSADCKPQ